MSLVDEVKNVDTRTMAQRTFDRHVEEVHQAIKEHCKQFARERKNYAEGMICKDTDVDHYNDYCACNIVPKQPLQYRKEMCSREQYGFSQLSRKERQEQQNKAAAIPKVFAPIELGEQMRVMTVSEIKQNWENIAREVRVLLEKDGFKTISLELVPIKHSYYVVKNEWHLTGMRYYKELVQTGIVYNYTIRFHVSW